MINDVKPTPGSPLAVDMGCLCPIYDNCYGEGCGADKNGVPLFWMNDACPIHGSLLSGDFDLERGTADA